MFSDKLGISIESFEQDEELMECDWESDKMTKAGKLSFEPTVVPGGLMCRWRKISDCLYGVSLPDLRVESGDEADHNPDSHQNPWLIEMLVFPKESLER